MGLPADKNEHLLRLSEHYLDISKPEKARETLAQMADSEVAASSPRYAILLSLALAGQGKIQESIELCREALRKDPQNAEVIDQLIHTLHRSFETYKEAVELAEQMISKYPKTYWYPYIIACSLFKFDPEDPRIENYLKTALRLKPQMFPVNVLAFDIACEKYDLEKAQTALDVLVQNDPERIETVFRLAELELLKKNYSAAAELAAQVLRINPDQTYAIEIAKTAERNLSRKFFDRWQSLIENWIELPTRRTLARTRQKHIRRILQGVLWASWLCEGGVIVSKILLFSSIMLVCIIFAIIEIPVFLTKDRTYVSRWLFNFAIYL